MESDERVDALLDVLIHLAAGKLHARAEVSDRGDTVDAIAAGLNMLAEEIEAKVGEVEARAGEVSRLNLALRQQVLERSRELAEALAELYAAKPERATVGPGYVVANRYRLVRKIGHGGMGMVFEAEDDVVGGRVAVKMLHPDVESNSTVIKRFAAEAATAASVEHPSIVRPLHVGLAEDGRMFIAMDYVDGVPLSTIADQSSLTGAEVARIGAGIADALTSAHAASIIHRDIKPANVLLSSRKPGVHVVDFGISKALLLQTTAHETRAGVLVGTPRYVSPEQVRMPAELTYATDVYSLGVVLYELLLNRPLFSVGTPHEWCFAHAHTSPPPISPSAGPPMLLELIVRCLVKAPGSRPTAAVVAAELGQLADAHGAPPAHKLHQVTQSATFSTFLQPSD